MNRDLALKYQAFLDGELAPREARQVAEALASDPEAQALVGELRTTKLMLADNEPEACLPEAREFYWSKIQRSIEHLEAQPADAELSGWRALLAAWRRYLAPMAGVAVIAFLAIAMVRFYDFERTDELTQHLAEIENLSEHTTSFSFRSDNMFVVWVQETSDGGTADQVDFIDNDGIVTQ